MAAGLSSGASENQALFMSAGRLRATGPRGRTVHQMPDARETSTRLGGSPHLLYSPTGTRLWEPGAYFG